MAFMASDLRVRRTTHRASSQRVDRGGVADTSMAWRVLCPKQPTVVKDVGYSPKGLYFTFLHGSREKPVFEVAWGKAGRRGASAVSLPRTDAPREAARRRFTGLRAVRPKRR